ncbi:hypothetical protein MAR_009009 [Mya arenaria]|nr:uncharacterized protein LOC128231380 [Mya arenaria]XP_052802865.1 uncharacterized protein LOC128233038 [Mya arenaria]WAR02451.1 hypothetical protein MAR_009009 [Mya arenaria]
MTVDNATLHTKMDNNMKSESDTMYEKFLRSTSNRLQDDLRTEMSSYSRDKDRLVRNLAHLHPPPPTPSTASIASTQLPISPEHSSRKSKFYRAPNMVRSLYTESESSDFSGSSRSFDISPEHRRKDRKDHAEKVKKEREMLKLPIIHSASMKRSEWESGNTRDSHINVFPYNDPLPGISAAKAFLADSMKIPSIHDPQRTDTVYNRLSKKDQKKVTFADENHGSLISINHIEPSETEKTIRNSKNSERKVPVPKLNLAKKQYSHTARPVRPQKTSLLPPLHISANDVRSNPQMVTEGVNEWKSLYSSIMNPEEKTKALNDIMNAVRLKKYENEQAMKYGNGPRPLEAEELVKDYLDLNASGKITYRDEAGNAYSGCMPTPRSSPRLQNGFPNTFQLQNYLRQMSRTKRVLEKIDGQEYNNPRSAQPTPVSVEA